MENNKYVLITPAKDESLYIKKTLESVISQTLLPEKWVVVSDGSTDGTDEIVKEYENKYRFIKLVKLPVRKGRNFSSKVSAFNSGYSLLTDIEYEYIGNLDADISFQPAYYEMIIEKFKKNDKLGIAGGDRFDVFNNQSIRIICSKNSVMGAVQFFCRKCFEEINGFIPLELGGEDAVAEIKARKLGWEVESFSEIKVYHHRRTGSASGSIFKASFNNGISNYLIGYHPLFQLFRNIKRAKGSFSVFFQAIFELFGYFCTMLKRKKRAVPEEIVSYLRSEQKERLKEIFSFTKIY